MELKESKLKYVKNVSNPSNVPPAYEKYGLGDEFGLDFSKEQKQQKVGDQILLEDKGKLIRVVEVVDENIVKTNNSSKHPYEIKVKTIAIIPNGIKKTDTSIADLDFTCLKGNTNLIPIDSINNVKDNTKEKIIKIFTNNGETL